jgi:hypothetical protein
MSEGAPSEFDVFDLSEFSQEDFAAVDDAVNEAYEVQQLEQLYQWLSDEEIVDSGPAVPVALEDSADLFSTPLRGFGTPTQSAPTTTSPYDRHRRRRKVLSVTDITSLAWYDSLLGII